MSRARCRPASGRTSPAQRTYSTEVVLQRFSGELTMLDGAGGGAGAGSSGGDFGADDSGSNFGSPAAAAPRRASPPWQAPDRART